MLAHRGRPREDHPRRTTRLVRRRGLPRGRPPSWPCSSHCEGAAATAGRSPCADCPVITECRAYALDRPELAGVWAAPPTPTATDSGGASHEHLRPRRGLPRPPPRRRPRRLVRRRRPRAAHRDRRPARHLRRRGRSVMTAETSASFRDAPVDNGPSEVDIAVDAALGDLVRCAYHDRWLRARLRIVEDHINTLRCENAQLRGIWMRPTAAWMTWRNLYHDRALLLRRSRDDLPRELSRAGRRGVTSDVMVTDPPYGETSLAWDRWPVGWPQMVAELRRHDPSVVVLRVDPHVPRPPRRLRSVEARPGHRLVEAARPRVMNDRFNRSHELVTHWYRGRGAISTDATAGAEDGPMDGEGNSQGQRRRRPHDPPDGRRVLPGRRDSAHADRHPW